MHTMKTLKEYLTESVKTYEYRIKIAGDLDDALLSEFEKKLAKFDLIKLTKPKKTPVMKSPAGFPELANQEIHIMDAAFNYPATFQEITEIWKQLGGNPNNIRMITQGYDDSVTAETEQQEQSPVLEKEYPAKNKQQSEAESAHADAAVVMNSAAGAKFVVAGGKTPPAMTTNDLPQGTHSPIEGKNKRPVPKSSAR